MIPGMIRRTGRRTRLTTVLPALAIFVAGTNLCLLSALTGQAMACMSTPVPRTSCPDCHHGANKSSGRTEAPTLSPCCVTLAPSSSVQIEKTETATATVAVADDSFEIVQAGFVRPVSMRERPPTSPPALGPFGGRAPPLL